jgi:site-specific recombinase XerD
MAEISPLRRRMIEDMTVRNLSPATQQSYIHAVAKFSRYFGCSPDRLGLEDVRAFQVHLVSKGISWASLNQLVCALRFFYGVTLGYETIPERITARVFSILNELAIEAIQAGAERITDEDIESWKPALEKETMFA